jgi:8-oxo-dGTP pyrophosphatase MutT (NUDIX family)
MPHEASLNPKKLLERYSSWAPYQRFCRKTMLHFLADYPHFSRESHIGHFTASAFLLNPKGTHALLLHHKKLGLWVQPGGHCDGEKDLLKVALQETREETGLEATAVSTQIFDLDIHWIPPQKAELGHFHFDVRFLLQAPSEKFQNNHESLDMCWSPLRKPKADIDDSLRRMFDLASSRDNPTI